MDKDTLEEIKKTYTKVYGVTAEKIINLLTAPTSNKKKAILLEILRDPIQENISNSTERQPGPDNAVSKED